MRLICPNCGAQYDVPVDVIPATGRDVQCSNCAHTWFQRHPDQDAELAEELGQPLPDPEWDPEDEVPTAPPVPERAPEPEPASEAEPPRPPRRPTPRPAPDVYDDDDEPIPAVPNRRSLDPEMAELFREERDFEARQREAEGLEMQPDLGLSAPDEDEQTRRSRQARERMARLKGEEPEAPRPVTRRPSVVRRPSDVAPRTPSGPVPGAAPRADTMADSAAHVSAEATAAAAAAGSRRDLLPDVDEINQTLRTNAQVRKTTSRTYTPSTAHEPEKAGGGFGLGFGLVVLIAALLVGVYVYAPQIGAAVPQVEPVLAGYTETVNDGRRWLDGQVTALLTMLDGMSSEAAPVEDAPAETPPAQDAGEAPADN
jgi:predicted Zn finger-like uncharacterized protein